MVRGQGGLSGLLRRGRTFGGLGLQYQPDGSSVINIFEGSFTEEGTGSGKAIFEGGLKFSASKSRNNLGITDSADLGGIGEQSIVRFLAIDYKEDLQQKIN